MTLCPNCFSTPLSEIRTNSQNHHDSWVIISDSLMSPKTQSKFSSSSGGKTMSSSLFISWRYKWRIWRISLSVEEAEAADVIGSHFLAESSLFYYILNVVSLGLFSLSFDPPSLSPSLSLSFPPPVIWCYGNETNCFPVETGILGILSCIFFLLAQQPCSLFPEF